MKILFLIIILLPTSKLWGLPEDPEKYKLWESNILSTIEQQRGNPPNVAIPKLGLWVYQLNQPQHQEREGRPVFNAAKQALLTIPGTPSITVSGSRSPMIA